MTAPDPAPLPALPAPGADPLAPGPGRDRAVRLMFDRIAARYDRMNAILTFGLDARWRRRAVAALELPAGSLVLDVACGTARIARAVAEAGHRCIGLDLSEGMLRRAGGEVPLVLADGLRLPIPGAAADAVTCGFALRNVVDLPALLGELGRVLRGGGRLVLLEVAEPSWAPARGLHRAYFHHVVPAVGALLSDRQAYRYLPSSAGLLPAPDRLELALGDAGFSGCRRRLLGLGAAQLVVATRV